MASAVLFTVKLAMSDEKFWGTVNSSVSIGLVRWRDPSELVHTVTGKAWDLDEDEIGRIILRLVSATEAENRGERLYEVCDADSAILEALYATLFDAHDEIRDDLDIEPGWNILLFVEVVEIAPGHKKTSIRVELIETNIALFCPEGLIVAMEGSLKLIIEEWRRLGFRRIAESPFVFREQLKVNPYDQSPAKIRDEVSYTCEACGKEIIIPRPPARFESGLHRRLPGVLSVRCNPCRHRRGWNRDHLG